MDLKRLTRPEYLSDQELRESLLFYHNIAVTDDMARCDVLELFRKVAQPLPQREKHVLRSSDLRSRTNEDSRREEDMEIDDNGSCSKRSKFSSQSVNQLRDQFHHSIRISNSLGVHNADSDVNLRKRLRSSEVEPVELPTPIGWSSIIAKTEGYQKHDEIGVYNTTVSTTDLYSSLQSSNIGLLG